MIPAAAALLMVGVSDGSSRPQTQKALYLPVVIASWICVAWVCGLLLPSKASIWRPSFAASVFAPFSDAMPYGLGL